MTIRSRWARYLAGTVGILCFPKLLSHFQWFNPLPIHLALPAVRRSLSTISMCQACNKKEKIIVCDPTYPFLILISCYSFSSWVTHICFYLLFVANIPAEILPLSLSLLTTNKLWLQQSKQIDMTVFRWTTLSSSYEKSPRAPCSSHCVPASSLLTNYLFCSVLSFFVTRAILSVYFFP